MDAERVIRDGNTYVRFGDKWYLIDGPVYQYLSSCLERWYAPSITLFTWDGSIFDKWETRSAVLNGKRTYAYLYKGGELLEDGKYNGCDWKAMIGISVKP